MLKTQDLTYWYQNEDDYLFKGVNVAFELGKMYAILGTSGSGKTTFLSLLSGLDLARRGEISYNDKVLKKNKLTRFRRKESSIVFQAYNLLNYMSAFQNVKVAMKISGVKKENLNAYVIESLKSVGLTEDLIHKKVTKLSGGQQQRVAIVRAMATGHDIIFADEPTGNLDEETSKEIVRLFQKIAHENNKLVIIVTHDKDIAESSDVVLELKGREFTIRDHTLIGASVA